MVLSCGYGQQQIGDNKKCRRIAGDFDCHTDAAVRRGAHLPIEHIQGFTRSHWMAGCTPRSTKVGSPAKMKLCRSLKRSTLSKSIGPTRLHSSTRRRSQPRNMGMAWPPWTTTRRSHRMANRLRTLARRTPPRNNG
jgi:hypothetical protein